MNELRKAVLKKDFYDLGTFKLMQNVWCYCDTIAERGGKTWQFIYDYCRWCEEILQEKWPEGDELPHCNFVINKLKKQETICILVLSLIERTILNFYIK